MKVKKFFDGIPLFRLDIDSRRRKLLNNPEVIELIKGMYVATLQGETPETYIKSMK